jgi:hypothetical protein
MLIRLHDGTRGHRVEAAGLALPLRPLARLAQVQESRCACGEARGGGGLGGTTIPRLASIFESSFGSQSALAAAKPNSLNQLTQR